MKRLALGTMLAIVLSAAAASPAPAATFLVNNTGDQQDGDTSDLHCDIDPSTIGDLCTLRAAIQQSNATLTADDEIDFGIASGAQTITLNDGLPLPDITDTVTIEGNTQTGFAGTPLITLKGTGTNGIDGLTFAAGSDGSQVNRLVFNNFKNAIRADADVHINGNYIGIGPAGTSVTDGENDIGVRITATSGGVGDVTGAVTDRNVISDNTIGIVVAQNGGSFQIFNNYIGTNSTGTAALSNGIGVRVDAGADGEVLTGNVISGNDSEGVLWNGEGGFVSGSRIGTNAAGTSAIPNGLAGVNIAHGSPTVSVGVISGNNGGGIRVSGGGTAFIFGNKIGVGDDGVTAIPNANGGGIDIASSDVIIGGLLADQGNVIANNGPWGIRIRSGIGNTGNEIRGDNSITGNSGLGIDLDPLGFNSNDPDPGAAGTPNLGQNYPVITSAVAGGAADGTLTSQPNTDYRIDLFKSSACDDSGYGEGQTHIGFVLTTSDPAGNATFSLPLSGSVAAGDVLTATATDDVANNTSEFSLCKTVPGVSSGGNGGGGSGGGGSTQNPNGEPDSNIGKIAKKASKLKSFSGTASDPEGQLAAVEIAVVSTSGGAKATAKRVKRCLNLQKSGKLKRKKAGKKGRCGPAKFLRAKGTTKWTYKLKRRLKRGKYVIYARAVDKSGKKESKFSKADRNRVAFRLR
jgi:hypothetical protein